jgi:hypothetical protein
MGMGSREGLEHGVQQDVGVVFAKEHLADRLIVADPDFPRENFDRKVQVA